MIAEPMIGERETVFVVVLQALLSDPSGPFCWTFPEEGFGFLYDLAAHGD